MIPRRCCALALCLAGALLTPIAASSALRSVAALPANTPVHRAPSVLGTCVLGTVGAPELLGDLFPPNDIYFMLIRPTTCGPCSVTVLSNVHVWLNFRKPCSVPVSISVVRAFGSPCMQPDEGQILFPAFPTLLTATDIGTQEFVVAVPAEWRLDTDAFLAVNFTSETDSCSLAGEQPRIALVAGCPHCVAYERVFGETGDVCQSGAGLPLISVDVSECVPTPTLRRSWGTLKLRYR